MKLILPTLLALSLAAGAQNSIFQIVPTPNQFQLNNTLYASSASSPNDIWAVGQTTIHFDGKQLKEFPAPGLTNLAITHFAGVVDFSPTLAWAAGGGDKDGQIIDRWNGQKWQRMSGTPFPGSWQPYVMTMSATSPTDIWITGDISPNQNFNLFFEHWNGKSWDNQSYLSGGIGWFYGAAQDSSNDAWVVGMQWIENIQAPLAVHYSGGNAWDQVDLPFPPGADYAELYGVLALSPKNVYIVGVQNSGAGGDDYSNSMLMYHYDGATWTIVPLPTTPGYNLAGIVASSPTDLYAYGYFSTDGYNFETLVLHGDGKKWKMIPTPSPGGAPRFDELLTGVSPAPGNVWLFGQGPDSENESCKNLGCTLALHTTTGD
jgi:hypothetical protein